MSPRQAGPYDSVARKWLALAKRRRAHLGELTSTGRWRHYYSAAALEQEIRKADALCAGWAANIGLLIEDGEPGTEPVPVEVAVVRLDFELDPGLDGGLVLRTGLDLGFGAEASHLRLLREAIAR